MFWEFSWSYFLIGIAIMIAGVLIVRFHMQIADELAGGVQSYDKVKLFGIIACAVGFIFMTNIHTTIFRLFLHLIMPDNF